MLRHDPLAKELERRGGSRVEEPVVALAEREQQAPVVLGEVARKRPLQRAEDGLALGLRPDQHERVVGDADERRGQHREERLVVVAVVQEPQVGEEVDDLLLAEVVPPRGAVGGQPHGSELLLEPLGVRARREEEDDLAGARVACVDQLAHALRDVSGLRAAPVDARLARGLLVRDEQLERGAQDGRPATVGRLEPLELVAELRSEELVHRREHLRPRAVVLGQRQDGRCGLPALPEDGDVRVPEPVDRLELVADQEEVALLLSSAEQVEQLGLEAVRVLELVHHDRAEPLALPLADDRVVAQQVAHAELEILEVEGGLALLRLRVRHRERRQELLEELAVARGERLERRGDRRVARLGEPGGARPAHLQIEERQEPLGQGRRGEELESRVRGGVLCLRRALVRDEAARRLTQRVEPLGERHTDLARLEDEVAARRAQRRVDLDEHAAEPGRAVRREQLPAIGLLGRAEALQRDGERLRLEHEGLWLVEHAEGGVDARRQRVRAEEAPAEAVDRGDPGAVELERQVRPAALEEPRADAGAKLARRALGVRDDEERLDVQPVVDHRGHEPLDEHGGLARPCAGRDEDGSPRVDRGLLLLVRPRAERRHARSLRQIRHRSHQCGHSPPCGSCTTSPCRMRSTSPTAVARAASTAASNSSGSR